jgi:hypothetical protein
MQESMLYSHQNFGRNAQIKAHRIAAFRSVIMECEPNGMNGLGMGAGIAPVHLGDLLPSCLSASNPSNFGSALATALAVARRSSSSPISSHQIYHKPEKAQFVEIQARLCNDGARFCPVFSINIQKQSILMDFRCF